VGMTGVVRRNDGGSTQKCVIPLISGDPGKFGQISSCCTGLSRNRSTLLLPGCPVDCPVADVFAVLHASEGNRLDQFVGPFLRSANVDAQRCDAKYAPS